MNKSIQVIGLPVDGSPPDEYHLKRINSADVLVGGTRHLTRFREFKGETIPIKRDIEGVMDAIAAALAEGKSVAVLATGDPLWFGIGSTLIRRFGREKVEIFPAVSTAQVALARLRLPMDEAIVLSRHRDTEASLAPLLYFPTGIILTNGPEGPARIIDHILHRFPGAEAWMGMVCQCLGMPEERIDRGPLPNLTRTDYLTPNLLVVENPAPLPLRPVSADFGRPDDWFSHERGLITHPEVRAVVLSKLELSGARCLWDVGAGSGAVGIEAALLNPTLQVHAVEKNRKRAMRIEENRERFRVPSLTIHAGDIKELLPSLPGPDRIFIGGGGKSLSQFLPLLFERLLPGGIAVAITITLESFEILTRFLRDHSIDADVIQIQTTRLTAFSGYHRMTPDNPITLYKFKKNP